VPQGTHQKVWWKCPKGPDHEWEAQVKTRVKGNGCGYCAGQKASVTNSLASLYPEIAAQWHLTKNDTLTPEQVPAGSAKKVWWKCPQGSDHEWLTQVRYRVIGDGCPCCSGVKVSVTNSLASRYPEIAREWHLEKNFPLTPHDVTAGSNEGVYWCCSLDPSHEWRAIISNRTNLGNGCPACKKGWTVEAIRGFISSLINHLKTFTPAELYLLFQQKGLLEIYAKGKGFVKALTTGRFPFEEVEKFVNGEPSIVDKFLQDKQLTLEALETSSNNDTLIKEM
jgi:hypothetical protein